MSIQSIRNLPMLQDIWQGGAALLLDKEISNGVKQGFLNHLGNIIKASFQTKVKSADFLTAMSTGVAITEGKPISQLDVPFNVTINAPSMRALDLAMFGSGVSTWTQTAVTSATTKEFDGIVANVWYKLPNVTINTFILTSTGGSPTTYTASTDGGITGDYMVDEELGAFLILPGGTISSGGNVIASWKASAVTAFPELSPRMSTRYAYGGAYIYLVLAANEARPNPEVWLRYVPRARLEPSGNLDFTVDKPGEITFDLTPVPSNEIANQSFGYLHQIAGTGRVVN
jgi:hypothetical protein